MDAMMSEAPQGNKQIIPIIQAALTESPIYIEHICKTLSTCNHKLRIGDDQAGMNAFARGTSDLGQFIQLFSQMASVSCPVRSVATDAFRRDLFDAVKKIEAAMNNQDMVTLSDQIEISLIPLLRRWNLVAQELQAGLDCQVD